MVEKRYPMAFVTAPGVIEFRSYERAPLEPLEVRLKVKAASICGGDLHIFKGKHPFAPLPVSVGHELAGEVIETGHAVTKVRNGDRVAVEPVIACGRCQPCRRGDYHLCMNISFQYRKGQGAFTPYFVAHEDRVFRLPDGLSYDEGALVEPLSVALHAVKKSGVRLAETSAVFGAGAIGLLVTMLLRQASGGRTFIVDVDDFRLRKGLELGACRAVHNRREDAREVILAETDGIGVDKAYEAVGMEMTLRQALESLRKGGTATLLGLFEVSPAYLPVNLFVQKEISLLGSQGYNWDFQDALVLLDQRRLDLKPLITHRVRLEDLQSGFEILLDPAGQAVKVVVVMEKPAV
jgi:threonine dehydrogenase-like Zn-dependent dehydrogenase